MSLFQLRMELHSHTDFDPQDWIEHSAEQLIDEAARQGISVLAITCHRALQWSPGLKAYAEAANVLLIPAVEASIEGKDVLIYGLERFEHPISFDQLRELRRQHPEILTIAPHPFYPSSSCLGRRLFLHQDCFDAIEYCHFYTRQVNFNQKAVEAARRLNKPLVGTSDIHFLSQVGKTTSTVSVGARSFAAVSAAIKAGQMELHTKPLSLGQLAFQVLQMFWMNLRSSLRRRGLLVRPSVATSESEH
ncbi:MAG: PHP domain-containing protein [Acidobacteria bacterium]|nr:PHP domain-containing protein [Acidobacteriota bacterium]MCI0723697.1 PHP domain-containing protein [Acidobacteriota bacterium]